MKIVHVIGGGETGGSRVHLLALCKGLRERYPDVDVQIICFIDGELARQSAELGIPVTVFPMRNAADLRVIPTLRRHLKDTSPTIVHTHGVRGGFVGRLAARGLNAAVIDTVHGSVYSDYATPLKRLFYPVIERSTRRVVARFIVLSSYLGKELENDGIPSHRITVIRNGLPDSPPSFGRQRTSLRRELGLNPDVPIIISVGRLEAVKGPDTLLEVFHALGRKIGFHGVVVGDGSLRGLLEHRAERLGLGGKVSFLGFRLDVPALLEEADVFVSTSRMEGMSMALLEVMRARTPVVVSRVGGNTEAVELARNGFAVQQGDVGRYVECIERLLRDPSLRDRLSRNGSKALSRHFSMENVLAETRKAYKEEAKKVRQEEDETPQRRVTVAGWYGAGNIGDEAILGAMIKGLREEGIHEITVLSWDPESTARMHGVKSLPMGRRFRGLYRIFKQARRSDLFILGGGGLLQDASFRVVPFWMSRVLLALISRTPVMYYAVGVGPLKSRFARWAVGIVSNRVKRITVRDEASKSLLRACGVSKPLIETTADPAVSLGVVSSHRGRSAVERISAIGGIRSIAVSVRPWKQLCSLSTELFVTDSYEAVTRRLLGAARVGLPRASTAPQQTTAASVNRCDT